MPGLDETQQEAVVANLFHVARPLVRESPGFPWRRRRGGEVTAGDVRSSQALAIDVFETIRRLPSCNGIVHKWVSTLFPRLASGRFWGISLERALDRELLREVGSRTQLDVLLTSSRSLINVTCTFTEAGVGGCRLVRPLAEGPHEGKIQCNGEYRMQQSPIDGGLHRCAHTAKGVRYWSVIPQVLGHEAGLDIVPCPFAEGEFEWMRQLVAAHELARTYTGGPLQPAFLLVYADGPFPMAQWVNSRRGAALVAHASRHAVPMATVSCQSLIAIARAGALPEDVRVLDELAEWVRHKVVLAA
jgi:hypothetical protein